MSINLLSQYPGKVGPVVAGSWPYGEPRNITTPGDGTGTPFEAAILKDIIGLQHALLTSGGIVPSGTPDQANASQYMQALVELSSGRADTYDETGAANAYVLTPKSGQHAPASYFVGMRVKFTATTQNNGPATINVAGLGVKTVINGLTGDPLTTVEIPATAESVLVYDGTNFLTEGLRGTWTPSVEGSSTAGTGWTHTIQNGTWTRSNKILTFIYDVAASNVGSGAAGDILIKGAPAAISTNAINSSAYSPIAISSGLDNTGGRTMVMAGTTGVSSDIVIVEQGGGVSFRRFSVTDIVPSFRFSGSISRIID